MKSPGTIGWEKPKTENGQDGGGKSWEKKEVEIRLEMRLWVPVGGRREIIFIPNDDGKVAPYKITEYEIKLNGDWKNYETKPLEGQYDFVKEKIIPVNPDVVNEYECFYFPCYLFPEKFTATKGKNKGQEFTTKAKLRAIPMKWPSYQKCLEFHNAMGNLAWQMFTFSRGAKNDAAATGNTWIAGQKYLTAESRQQLEPTSNVKDGAIRTLNWERFLAVKSTELLEAKYSSLTQEIKEVQRSEEQVGY